VADVVNGQLSLRFYGHGVDDIDRVKIQVDDPANSDPGPPVDVGATDFTIEFWMKARASENTAGLVSCGENKDWIFGNIILDRDRFGYDRKYGLSITGGILVFGVSGAWTGDRTICGVTNVLDGQWHHVAIQRRRSDGWMWLYVDGNLESQVDGPDGDISYPDDGVPGYQPDYCQGPGGSWGGVCVNDSYLVIGAEKHDAGSAYPSYSGWIDEVRLSSVLRYTATFVPPSEPFTSDGDTVALYHLDEGPAGACTGTIVDSSGAVGGPSNGTCSHGGAVPSGPVYTTDTPFSSRDTRAPVISNVTASPWQTGARIDWETDEGATSQVSYGVSPTLSITTSEAMTHVVSHSVVLTDLTPSTSYVYVVHSVDAAGNAAASPELSFTTTVPLDAKVYIPLIVRSFMLSVATRRSMLPRYLAIGFISTMVCGATALISMRIQRSNMQD
jgi:hypothetical protein